MGQQGAGDLVRELALVYIVSLQSIHYVHRAA